MISFLKSLLVPVLLSVGQLITVSNSLKGEQPAPAASNRPYVGIRFQDLPQGMAHEIKLPDTRGILVADVFPKSPAAVAGLKPQDVIIELDGVGVADQASFAAMIRQLSPEKKITIKFIRGGQADTTTVTVGSIPPSLAYAISGDEKYSKRDWTGAIADYTEAIRLDPKYIGSFFYRGAAKLNRGDLDSAIADFTETLLLDPKNAAAYLNRGIAKANSSDWNGAIADDSEAIRLEPKQAQAHFYRGLAKHNKGDFDGATADYTTAITLDPTYQDAYLNRGLTRSKGITQDSRRKPGRKEIAAAQKRSAEATADFQEAIRRYTEWIRLHPDSFRTYIDRATAKEKLGDTTGAARDRAESVRVQEQVTLARFQEGIARASLSDLIASSDQTVSQARERNRTIVAAKNQQLPAIIRGSKSDELNALVVKIEQTILDLNHEGEVAKDQAQQATASNGEGRQLDELRGLALCYRERIELLKPVLTALKEEIANRNR